MMAIETPLGKDHLLLRSFTGREGISQLFIFDLDLLSEDSAIKFKDIVGKRVTIRITLANEKQRYFNGFISKFAQIGCDTGLTTYKATMVPWLWFLTQTTDCRIFQRKSVPDIVQQIFKEYGFTDVKPQLQGTYEPREYCVQYRETDYNFVARLLEQYGIFYYFAHENGKHTLVLGDDPSVHQPCPEKAKAHWQLPGGGAAPEEDVITGLMMEQIFRPGKWTLSDYFFKAPSTSLLSEVSTTLKIGGNEKFELYHYPGEYEKKSQGEALAQLRMEEEEAKQALISGTGNCRAFTSGYKFELTDYGRQDMNKAYLITEVRHTASLGESYTSGTPGGGKEDYANQFSCIPHAVPFRPPRVLVKSLIQGYQTAVVVGPSGEEIYTDNHGRVKVQFHWDREGKKDEDSSCWMLVSQVHAGKGFGGIDIPRIGEEVIVSFLEGDADRPMIVGRVYNAQNMPPNGLPGAGMISGLKSNSTPGGGGNNSIMMDDTKGNELYSMNAQYNCTQHVGNDRTTTIDHDESLTVTNNRTKKVGVDQSEDVGSNKKIHVGATHTETIVGDKTMTIGGSHTETISGNETITVKTASAHTIILARALSIGAGYQVTVGGTMNESIVGLKAEEIGGLKSVNVIGNSSETTKANKSTDATGNISEKAGKNISMDAGTDISAKAGKNIATNAGDNIDETAGKDVTIKAGKNLLINVGDKITIQTGKAMIQMSKSGDIVIEGKNISVTAKGGEITMDGKKILMNS